MSLARKYIIRLYNLEKKSDREAFEDMITRILVHKSKYELKDKTFFLKTVKEKTGTPETGFDEVQISEQWVRVEVVHKYNPEVKTLMEVEKELKDSTPEKEGK